MERKSNSSRDDHGHHKKSGGSSGNNSSNNNAMLPPGMPTEPNLAELFAAHNLLASSGMGGHGSNPLALLQQQMNMQYATPAAWWYLEYLSRIQAAQMVPNLQGTPPNPPSLPPSTPPSNSANSNEREGSSGGGGGGRRRSNAGSEARKAPASASSSRGKHSEGSQGGGGGGSGGSSAPPQPPPSRSSGGGGGSGGGGRRGGSGSSNAPSSGERGGGERGGGGGGGRSRGGRGSSSSSGTHLPPSSHHQLHPPPPSASSSSSGLGGGGGSALSMQLLPPASLLNLAPHRGAGGSSGLGSGSGEKGGGGGEERGSGNQNSALNLSSKNSREAKNSGNGGSGSSSGAGGSGESSKNLHLPSSVTIIPHAHSKPDSLTSPRFPPDYVPKPAHATKPTLYSHPIPKVPQVGLIKGEKSKRKSTVASLLQQSRGGALSSSLTPPNPPHSSSSSSSLLADGGGGGGREERGRGGGGASKSSPYDFSERGERGERGGRGGGGDSKRFSPLCIGGGGGGASSSRQGTCSPMSIGGKSESGSECGGGGSGTSGSRNDKLVPPTASTPPHRPWLNSSSELTIPSPSPSTTTTTSTPKEREGKGGGGGGRSEPDLNSPLLNGWRRETLLKGLSSHGLNGEVSYVSPNNVTIRSMQELKKVVGTAGIKNYSFSSKLLIGDFLLPGQEGTVLKLTSAELANWLKEEAKQTKKEEERIKGERERKKEHAGLVRALELYRRSRRRYKLQQERKAKKRTESQLELANVVEPKIESPVVEADEILTERKLRELEDIKGLYLNPVSFGNILHIYEFLHTFGNTLGFDMESLPSLSSLQRALLHVDENEEEVLSVLSHLLVCAVEDPGMPNPNKHLTPFGQTLKQADITFGSLSEVLRLYLSAVSDSEPEAVEFSSWLAQAPFLALSPTRKSRIISFICDLLLQNKAVLKHLDSSSEAVHNSRKERQQNEIKIRKLRILAAKKAIQAAAAANNTNLQAYTEKSQLESIDGVSRSGGGGEKEEGKNDEKSENEELCKSSSKIDEDSKEQCPLISKPNSSLDDEPLFKDKKIDPSFNGLGAVTNSKSDLDEEMREESFEPNNEDIDNIISSIIVEDKDEDEDEKMGLIVKKEESSLSNNSSPLKIGNETELRSPLLNTPVKKEEEEANGAEEGLKNNSLSGEMSESKSVGANLNSLEDDVSFLESSSSSDESDSDAKLSGDELRVKMSALQKATERLKQVQSSSMKVIRSQCLGQDRYRRRYWNLPAAGGIYVEGGASGEFDELRERVRAKFTSPDSFKDESTKSVDGSITKNVKNEEEGETEEEEGSMRTKLVKNEEDEEEGNVRSKSVKNEKGVKNEEEEGNVRSKSIKNEEGGGEEETVPPPCIKIFSFAPREGCSGRVREVVVKEEGGEEEDETFVAHIQERHWNSWWKIEKDVGEFTQDFSITGIREPGLRTALNSLTTPLGLIEDDLDDEEVLSNMEFPILSPPSGWDPELSYKVHIQLLETLETLEERVGSASLQVKGWQIPSRPSSQLSEEQIIELVKERLLELEAAVERRYLKPPLGKSAHDLNLLANLAEGGSDTYVGSKALTHWREAISRATVPAVLSMAVYSLDSSIAWDKSVMKASCQLCKGGDNEDKLLLCDACDRGYHTYCFKPPLETIPDGDWFCWECINKATQIKACIVCGKGSEVGKIVACDKCAHKAYHLDCIQPQLQKVPRGRWSCPDHKSPTKKRKSDSVSDGSSGAGPSSKKNGKKTKSEMVWCEKILDDLAQHEDAWPFLDPVNTRQFPTYKKIIKNPMDIATIRTKMSTYKSKAEFLGDIKLIFDNCLTFNEDDSPVGKAGHNLRVFFESISTKP